MRARLSAALASFFAIVAVPSAEAQNLPLAPERAAGQTVTPVFEGWYRNADGSYSLSFGYFNRNTEEVLEIPVGPNNRIEPGGPDRGQPTRFEARRHWGVFAVRVPADFGENKVVWTLVVRGQTFAIPGSLKRGWQIDALEGEAGTGNTPPRLRFGANAPEGAGPGGKTSEVRAAQVGAPLPLMVWADDDGKARSSVASGGRPNVPVTLRWFKHQGPGNVTFADETPAVDTATKQASTTVTFDAPGDYILRVRANDASGVSSAGHAQCCWSNAFVKVRVTR